MDNLLGRPLEVEVRERVVLDPHRESPLARPQRDTARQRPAEQHAVSFQPEVVVQLPGNVALHDEAPTGVLAVGLERLRGVSRATLGPVLAEPLRGGIWQIACWHPPIVAARVAEPARRL